MGTIGLDGVEDKGEVKSKNSNVEKSKAGMFPGKDIYCGLFFNF
jgi:hypothetical protein